jgi:ribonuclease Z
MQIIFLGTSGSWPTKERNVPAIALKLESEIILFDCGEGTQRQFMHSKLSFMNISKILITHLHGDHFLGIPGLVQTMSLNNRKKSLEIYGPIGIRKTIRSLLCIGYFSPTFKISVNELRDNQIIHCPKYNIKVIETVHVIPTLAYCIQEHDRPGKFNLKKAKKLGIPEGPLFSKLQSGESISIDGKKIIPEMVLGVKRKGRKVVYSGDTKPFKSFINFAKDCDVLIHDGTASVKLEKKANKYGHSSFRQAGIIANKCNAKALFLTHISPRYTDGLEIKKEVRSIFKRAFVAEDFMEYEVRVKK